MYLRRVLARCLLPGGEEKPIPITYVAQPKDLFYLLYWIIYLVGGMITLWILNQVRQTLIFCATTKGWGLYLAEID